MDEQEERALAAQLDAALPAVLSLPVAICNAFGPVIWVESHGRADVQDLQARLSSLGEHFSQLNEFELRKNLRQDRGALDLRLREAGQRLFPVGQDPGSVI